MRFHRLVLLAAAPLALAALLGSAAPAGASLSYNAILSNALSTNSLSFNALSSNALAGNGVSFNAILSNALAATGSALDELNGVAVEAVALPDMAQ